MGLKPTTTGMGRYLRILNKIKIPFSGHKHDWAGRPGRRPGGFEDPPLRGWADTCAS